MFEIISIIYIVGVVACYTFCVETCIYEPEELDRNDYLLFVFLSAFSWFSIYILVFIFNVKVCGVSPSR